MRYVREIALALVIIVAGAGATMHAATPTAKDRETYERLIEIIFAGTPENKQTAREALKNMGEVGVALAKTDCKDIESPKGAFAWTLLMELLGQTDLEPARRIARDNILDVAKHWNETYTERQSSNDKRKRLEALMTDFVNLLVMSGNNRDLDLLLKTLKYSLITEEGKTDFGGEFDVWQKVWAYLGARVRLTADRRELDDWQKTIDEHFRTPAQKKVYVGRKTIVSYHTLTLMIINRAAELDAAEKKEAIPEEMAP